MKAMIRRNLMVYFRDKSSVFFSLMAVFIIVGLYVLFLGNNIAASLEGVPGADILVGSWLMAGILSVVSVTTTMGAFGIMVEDKSKKIIKDFNASPISRPALTAGYISSAIFVGLIMSFITLILVEVYLVSIGGELLSAVNLLKTGLLMILSVISSSALIFFVVSMLKSQNAFATASTIIGTLIGFLTGIYIPIGVLPDTVQSIIKLFPISYSGMLLRQVMMQQPIAVSFSGVPAQAVDSFRLEMGVIYQFAGNTVSALTGVLILLVTALLFYGLSVWSISRKPR